MNTRVNVLIVLDYINNNSGTSTVVMNYYSHMQHTNIQMDFLLYEKPDDDILKKLQDKGSKVYALGHPVELGIGTYHKVIRDFFREHKNEYSIVHLHISNAAFVVLKYAKKYGVKTRIMHSHNSRGADGCLKKIRNYILNKYGIIFANRYFACSKFAGEYLYGAKNNSQVTIINNAIDISEYSYDFESREKVRDELQIGEKLVLGHVGRFSEQKNHNFLIEIAKHLKQKNIDFKLLLLGGGELCNEIETKIRALNLEENVIFAGVVENVKAYLDAMDIFLLPSLYEGLPCVCIEAQANGLSCILSDRITKEVKLNNSVDFLGILNADIWVDKILEIYNDKQLRLQRGDSNRNNLEQYDITLQAKKLEEIYLSYGNSSNINVNV